jgi:hypothetical protein
MCVVCMCNYCFIVTSVVFFSFLNKRTHIHDDKACFIHDCFILPGR